MGLDGRRCAGRNAAERRFDLGGRPQYNGAGPDGRDYRQTVSGQRLFNWLMIEMADGAGALGIGVVVMPCGAERGREDQQPGKSQGHDQIAQ